MLVKNQQAPATSKRTSRRKHEGVRTPTARNAIVRDRESGAYQANVDVALSEIESLKLRVNALELECSRLRRGAAVDSGYAAPLSQAGNNVVPMSVARQAKAEKDKAVHVSHPLPVSGNEAHVLPSPSTEPPVSEPRKGNYEPTLVGKVDTIASRAANDEDVHPPEVGDRMAEISHLSSDEVAQLADSYGMDVVEASEILYKEYSRREKQCYKDHGLPRDDVKLMRLSRQHHQCVVGDSNFGIIHYIPPKECESRFSDWWNETEARMKNLRANSAAREAAEYRSPANHGKLVKGEAKYRKREFIKARAAARTPDRAAFGRVQDISRKLYVGAKPTSDSQIKAVGTMLYGAYQKTRKLLGMQPTVRGMAFRPGYGGEANTTNEASQSADLTVTTTYGGHLAKTLGLSPQEAKDLPMRELVRRYQRAGIV